MVTTLKENGYPIHFIKKNVKQVRVVKTNNTIDDTRK